MIDFEGMSLKEMREACKLKRTEASKLLGIPWRTLQDWELGVRKYPPYIYRWLKRDYEEICEKCGENIGK